MYVCDVDFSSCNSPFLYHSSFVSIASQSRIKHGAIADAEIHMTFHIILRLAFTMGSHMKLSLTATSWCFRLHLLQSEVTQFHSALPSDKHLTQWCRATPAYVPLPPNGTQRFLSTHHCLFESPGANLSSHTTMERSASTCLVPTSHLAAGTILL